MTDKELYQYSFDGKTFVAHATSLSDFVEIMNRNSSWKRYSFQHVKQYLRSNELHGLSALVANEMFAEGFEGVWINKFIYAANFRNLIQAAGLDKEITTISIEEYKSLRSSDVAKLIEENKVLREKIEEIKELLSELDASEKVTGK